MNGFDRRRENKKISIINAAYDLFYSNNYEDVRVEDIAQAAHVSPASVYNFFGTKKTLLMAAIKKYFNENLENVSRKLDEAKTFFDKLKFFFNYKTNSVIHNRSILNSIDLNDPSMQDITVYVDESWFPLLEKIIRYGREEGVIPKDFSEKAILLYILCLSKGMYEPISSLNYT